MSAFKNLKDLKDINKLKELKVLKNINVDKAKQKIDKFVDQAKESIKVLESLQREGMSMAKNYVKTNDLAGKTRKFTDEKIKKNLHKLGLATFEEVKALEKKLDGVSTELKKHLSKIRTKKD